MKKNFLWDRDSPYPLLSALPKRPLLAADSPSRYGLVIAESGIATNPLASLAVLQRLGMADRLPPTKDFNINYKT